MSLPPPGTECRNMTAVPTARPGRPGPAGELVLADLADDVVSALKRQSGLIRGINLEADPPISAPHAGADYGR
jgi:hypothetical protein